MRARRVRELERLARAWDEIADDGEAAPTGTMHKVVLELLRTVKDHRKLLKLIRPWLDMIAVSDDDPRPKQLLQALDEQLGVRTRASKKAARSQ